MRSAPIRIGGRPANPDRSGRAGRHTAAEAQGNRLKNEPCNGHFIVHLDHCTS